MEKITARAAIPVATEPGKERFGKARRVAIFLAYVGDGYAGMQHNPGVRTLESELMGALAKADAISPANAGKFDKVHWSRAARTDKGVSAVGNVVSLKMVVDNRPGLLKRINAALPPQVRVLGWEPEAPLDEAERARIDAVLAQYVGTHSFHNFTVRVAAGDPVAKRFILSFRVGGALQLEGRPWVRLVVLGQSFMMHQIRKMVGAAVAVCRGAAPPDSLKRALTSTAPVPTPLAPELGLFLDECEFDSYNSRWAADGKAALSLTGALGDAAEAFKLEHVYPHIARKDAAAGAKQQPAPLPIAAAAAATDAGAVASSGQGCPEPAKEGQAVNGNPAPVEHSEPAAIKTAQRGTAGRDLG
ncbi:hypothetical protein WJX81_001378 [Elliptochloris bilobata]|uniref:Pseudouridine synthase I TruA alpha/beta domain-containing protein n=1 Tax=Elliptochloris bilobata TaxID=381761 RepID=A0AAW1QZV0_9CHLO